MIPPPPISLKVIRHGDKPFSGYLFSLGMRAVSYVKRERETSPVGAGNHERLLTRTKGETTDAQDRVSCR